MAKNFFFMAKIIFYMAEKIFFMAEKFFYMAEKISGVAKMFFFMAKMFSDASKKIFFMTKIYSGTSIIKLVFNATDGTGNSNIHSSKTEWCKCIWFMDTSFTTGIYTTPI